MAEDGYVLTTVRLALDKASGSRTEAQRLVAAQCMEDSRLLLGLAAPHLKAIIAHAITRVLGGEGVDGSAAAEKPELPSKAVVSPPKPASKHHVAAMNQIIGAFRKKSE